MSTTLTESGRESGDYDLRDSLAIGGRHLHRGRPALHGREADRGGRTEDDVRPGEDEKPFRNQPDLAAIRLNNDNTLITLENERRTIEVDKNDSVVWER